MNKIKNGIALSLTVAIMLSVLTFNASAAEKSSVSLSGTLFENYVADDPNVNYVLTDDLNIAQNILIYLLKYHLQ